MKDTAFFHLPGMFEFFDFYKEFIPLFYNHREYFYDNSEIGSVYGSPSDCIWSGGRVEYSELNPEKVLSFYNGYGISARLTFSNSLLEKRHLDDRKCNSLCELFASGKAENGVIVHSELLTTYLKKEYPGLYLVSSTTKVLTDFAQLRDEVNRKEFRFVVPDFRLNKDLDNLMLLDDSEKSKIEFLCNECCSFGCTQRKECYESVSRINLSGADTGHKCTSDVSGEGYLFSNAKKNPGFISREDIEKIYVPSGFSNFKIEGRSLGSALILEFLLYYMTRPEYQLNVREKLYLSNTLDLF